ncbi:uncharacterized protein LOC23687767 isoform X2 [Aedes aegypti]|uniref:Uncharacterized protein n=1 Tax=Aedes aegypti TaxID=7159 RepID=A0A6I8TQ84_AEDAE|nr:uncharacterized protein LOC23687767 isoform X2 [Aedes aegypti]
MVHVKSLKVKLLRDWSCMKKFIWHDEAGDDYFRLLDYVAVFAGSAMILMALTAYFAKCYFWCWVISSFQEVNELIALNIMQLITAIPHPAEHHLKYIELRTMLMIMMIRTQSSAQFSCGGLSIISVELFGNLLNVSYSVITFLLNII